MSDAKEKSERTEPPEPLRSREPDVFALPSGAFKQRFDAYARRAGIADRQHFASGWAQRKQTLYDTQFEARIGAANFLPFGFLQRAATLGRAVCKITAKGVNFGGRSGEWSGSGFMVGQDLLLTNHHVLNSVDVAQSATLIFDFHADAGDDEAAGARSRTFTLDPETLFVTSPATGGLDYTFVATTAVPEDFGTIRMSRGALATDFMRRANIIQHPDGRPKEVVLQDNQVLSDDHPLFLHYVTDTEGGSSGAPVFDNNWHLKALHHASRKNLEQERPAVRSFMNLSRTWIEAATSSGNASRTTSSGRRCLSGCISTSFNGLRGWRGRPAPSVMWQAVRPEGAGLVTSGFQDHTDRQHRSDADSSFFTRPGPASRHMRTTSSYQRLRILRGCRKPFLIQAVKNGPVFIHRTSDTMARCVQDAGTDHGCGAVITTRKFLNGAFRMRAQFPSSLSDISYPSCAIDSDWIC